MDRGDDVTGLPVALGSPPIVGTDCHAFHSIFHVPAFIHYIIRRHIIQISRNPKSWLYEAINSHNADNKIKDFYVNMTIDSMQSSDAI